MFETIEKHSAHGLRALLDGLGDLGVAPTDRERVDQLEGLERLKSAAAAAQARIGATFGTTTDAGRPVVSDRSLGAQLGLARRESPHQGREHLCLSRALVYDLPEALGALERGDITEHQAQIIVTETSDLSAADRSQVDAELAGRLAESGDREIRYAVQRLVMRIDEAGALRRRQRAHTRRCVSGRRVPDGMGVVSATVSDIHYAAIMWSLSEHAARCVARGDERNRSQIIADTFVERLTGQVMASAVPIALNLVMSAEALLSDDPEPADILGQGPIPACVARAMVVASPQSLTSIQRLFTFPTTGRLVAMESSRRRFDGGLAHYVRVRDQLCRTPFCNAPIRHIDHPEPVAGGGDTSAPNGQGLCESCNYTKEDPGWAHRVVSGPMEDHVIEITTPTGHRHQSRAPNLPLPERSPMMLRLDTAITEWTLAV